MGALGGALGKQGPEAPPTSAGDSCALARRGGRGKSTWLPTDPPPALGPAPPGGRSAAAQPGKITAWLCELGAMR